MDLVEIPVGDEVFRARVAGPEDGELVLLLHGFPETSWSWRHQLSALADAGYRAVAPDQRGYSPGARPAEVERYAVSHLVADVLAIADEMGGHTFHLVGHDWGAAVAWQVAGRHPHRLRTLTILSVPHPLAFTRALRGEGGSDQASRSSYFDEVRAPDAAERFLADDAARLRTAYGDLPDVEPYLEVLREPGAMDGALNWYRAMGRDLVDGLGPITAPTLFVWSTEDPSLGPEAAHWTEDYVEGPYSFEVLHGVSHWIAEEAADRFTPMLLEHLRR